MSGNGKSGIGKRKRDDVDDHPDCQSERSNSPGTLMDDRRDWYCVDEKAVEYSVEKRKRDGYPGS